MCHGLDDMHTTCSLKHILTRGGRTLGPVPSSFCFGVSYSSLVLLFPLAQALDRKAAMGSYTSAAAVKSRHTLSDSLDTFGASLTHVNALFNRKFGYSARKVPAHMPHFIDKTIMERLHET